MKTVLVSEIGDLILFNLDGTATETHNLTSRRVSCCEASPSSRNIVAVGSFVCKWFTLLTINIPLYIVILLNELVSLSDTPYPLSYTLI